ncbi:dendritic arbor reduction protein 1-like [Drosophila nasuta]|uniref:dendritic arbor reduction protein 1-like n=1 Tax=Drosophila nasuta TaxID=42062 RepID=UPI00295E6B40|nr:dendritic arbor reduction protein 1-like [Drosophila nasuta]
MFCSESCEHGINATSSGRILCSKKSGAPVEQQSSQMGQQQHLLQHQQQHQRQQQQQQQRLRFDPQQPSCSMFCDALPPADLWMQNCNSAPQRMGTCIVTEGPEGLSIDCNVPIPNSFNLDGYNPQLLSFLATPGGNDNTNNNNNLGVSLPVDQLPQSVKQTKVERNRKKSQQQSQSTASVCHCCSTSYPTSYAPSTEMSPDMNASPPVTVMPVNQLLAYLSGVMCPPAAATTSPPYPPQNLPPAPSCCHIQVHSLQPMQQQQQQQQQLPPTFAAQPPALMRFELPCMLTGFTSGQLHPEQPQPPFALQLLPLPYAGSMPSMPSIPPLPIPAESLSTQSKPTKLSTSTQSTETCVPPPATPPLTPPAPSTASSPTHSLPCSNLGDGPKKPILISRKAGPQRNNIDAQHSYGRRPSFPLGNGNGNGCRNGNRISNTNGNGNSCMNPPWYCSHCSHCCYHPCDLHQRS